MQTNNPSTTPNIKQNADFASDLSATPDQLGKELRVLVERFESPEVDGQALRLLWNYSLRSLRCTCSTCSNSNQINNQDIHLLLLISAARALAERRP